jgi:CubicO group peptidase (beta-lactamase class C family)
MLRRFVLALVLLIAPVTYAQIDTKTVDSIVMKAIAAFHVPGAAVAVVQNDRVVYAKGFGVTQVGGTTPVTADTLFGLGSTTKAFTSTAMAMLVTDGKMNWDDPVRKYVTYFHLSDPCADSLVTLRDIVSHRTGLSRHDELWDNTPLTREQTIRAIGMVALTKPFRSAYQYNNIMFTTAGEAVASAAGTSWDDFVRTRIFKPLGMNSSAITLAEFNASNHANGHSYDRRNDRAVPQAFVDPDNLAPAGAIASSANDMAQWLRFQLADGAIGGKRLVAADALHETKTPQTVIRLEGETKLVVPETNIMNYAMGWNVSDYRGAYLVSHGGALNGFRAQVALFPNLNAGLVVLFNLGRGYAGMSIKNSISDLLLGRPGRDWNSYYLDAEKTTDTKDDAAKAEREAKRVRDTKPSRELAAYAGTYTNPAYGAATITVENEALVLRWNRVTVPLRHFDFDTFRAESERDDLDEEVSFHLAGNGDVKTMTFFGEQFEK